jgi:hypothetical protein
MLLRNGRENYVEVQLKRFRKSWKDVVGFFEDSNTATVRIYALKFAKQIPKGILECRPELASLS